MNEGKGKAVPVLFLTEHHPRCCTGGVKV